jgi:hypothetical protein
MKTFKMTKIVKGFVLATSLVVGLTACGKKADNNNQAQNVFQQSNLDGEINGQPFFETTTRAYSQNYWTASTYLTLNWQFAGQNISPTNPQNNNNSFNNGFNNSFSSPAMAYSGKVAAAGSMVIAAPLNLSFCGLIPAGTYNLTTATVGRWNQGQISGVRIVLSGPVTFYAVLYNAQATEFAGNNYPYQQPFNQGFQQPYQSANGRRITGTLQIEQVNGYYCQGASYYMY